MYVSNMNAFGLVWKTKPWETRKQFYDRMDAHVRRIYRMYSEGKRLQAKIRDLTDQKGRVGRMNPDYRRLSRAIRTVSAELDE